ncbi:sensor histidine kinase [Sphingomonas sp. S2-65]|uniref:sensor histidine kinase n=1 Tax=Sphingomonas sp. S2-65 TaxID=2903960 RepID=UPI001F2B3891|nr:HAMP domain-containing sensor histidine kinase [Sphingomonas sp. S2-65]UYY60039.1 HAMP domain-containing histidine kinase [Sphingomonas sp. S2-65]
MRGLIEALKAGTLVEALKAPVRRHWPRLRLRTLLLVTFVFVAALPGIGALFLRVYENTLVRQTEAELIAQSAALSAAVGAAWPGAREIRVVPPARGYGDPDMAGGALSTIDLRSTKVLPERPAPLAVAGGASAEARAAAVRAAPVLRVTAGTTLASIRLLDAGGRVLLGPEAGKVYSGVAEIDAARAGAPATVLRRNGDYRPRYRLEWLSRASDLRIHHAAPVVVNGRTVAVLLLSRSPRALFRGLYEDRGKILFGIAAIFAALVVLSGLLSRGIVRPIEALSEATRAVARGGGQVPDVPRTAATEIQALYADFATMAAAIEQRSRYLRDFAHAVSHEFKTPLAGIRGAIEILEDHHEGMAPADRRRFLANIDADAGRLTLLVQRLLELARADVAGRDAGAISDVRLILARVADALGGRGLRVEIEAPEGLVAAAVQAASLEAILTGLVENGRQAGAGQVRLVARKEAGFVVLEVADDGSGIPAADRARVFEPFFTSRRASGGTGLGLPIARSLLEAQGGSIALAEDGPGTRFVLRIPVAGPPSPSPRP